MINGLFCQFHSHFLVNDNLSANLCDGLLDSATFLDAVSRWQTAMEQFCYSGNAVNVLICNSHTNWNIFQLYLVISFFLCIFATNILKRSKNISI